MELPVVRERRSIVFGRLLFDEHDSLLRAAVDAGRVALYYCSGQVLGDLVRQQKMSADCPMIVLPCRVVRAVLHASHLFQLVLSVSVPSKIVRPQPPTVYLDVVAGPGLGGELELAASLVVARHCAAEQWCPLVEQPL